ncbi:MAG TPA: sporulation protein [Methanothermobacter sp.]|nr:sporulation protein [Methanothermobacter sp.]
MMEIEDPIKATVEELLKVLAIENVIGEIIEAEDKMLIPVTRMGMGFGAGMGEGKSPTGQGEGKGGGAGGGAGIEPIAMIVVFKGVSGPEGVKVLPLTSPGPIARTIGEIGSVVTEIVKEKKKKKEKKKEEKE